MKKIHKSYHQLLHLANNSKGRKEVVSLLKKAAKLKALSEYKHAA